VKITTTGNSPQSLEGNEMTTHTVNLDPTQTEDEFVAQVKAQSPEQIADLVEELTTKIVGELDKVQSDILDSLPLTADERTLMEGDPFTLGAGEGWHDYKARITACVMARVGHLSNGDQSQGRENAQSLDSEVREVLKFIGCFLIIGNAVHAAGIQGGIVAMEAIMGLERGYYSMGWGFDENGDLQVGLVEN
jgi:hypothetical protein